jgi:hypothetical protein
LSRRPDLILGSTFGSYCVRRRYICARPSQKPNTFIRTRASFECVWTAGKLQIWQINCCLQCVHDRWSEFLSFIFIFTRAFFASPAQGQYNRRVSCFNRTLFAALSFLDLSVSGYCCLSLLLLEAGGVLDPFFRARSNLFATINT